MVTCIRDQLILHCFIEVDWRKPSSVNRIWRKLFEQSQHLVVSKSQNNYGVLRTFDRFGWNYKTHTMFGYGDLSVIVRLLGDFGITLFDGITRGNSWCLLCFQSEHLPNQSELRWMRVQGVPIARPFIYVLCERRLSWFDCWSILELVSNDTWPDWSWTRFDLTCYLPDLQNLSYSYLKHAVATIDT